MTSSSGGWSSAALRLWAVSPVVLGLILLVDTWIGSDRFWTQGSVQWYLTADGAAGILPTPDAVRTSLRHELPSDNILYEGLGHITVRDKLGTRQSPALMVELVAPGGTPLFSAVRSSFFGPSELDLGAMLEPTLAHGDGPKSLVLATEQADAITLAMKGGAPYAKDSLVRAIQVKF